MWNISVSLDEEKKRVSLLWDLGFRLSRHYLNLPRCESKYWEDDPPRLSVSRSFCEFRVTFPLPPTSLMPCPSPSAPPPPSMPPGQDRAAKLTAAVIVSTLLQAPGWSLELGTEESQSLTRTTCFSGNSWNAPACQEKSHHKGRYNHPGFKPK